MKTAAALLLALALALACAVRAAEEPQLVEVVDFSKLLPILPNPPDGWTADKAEGSTDDIGGTKITSAHRDYKKGEGDTAPTTSISIPSISLRARQRYICGTAFSPGMILMPSRRRKSSVIADRLSPAWRRRVRCWCRTRCCESSHAQLVVGSSSMSARIIRGAGAT